MPIESGPLGESLNRFDHARKWSELEKLSLLPGIRSIDEYDTRFFSNIIATLQLLTHTPQTLAIPSPDEVRAIHRAVFADIHPWAGCFRKKALGIGGRIGADHTTLVANLELARAEAEALQQTRAWNARQVAAFYHVRFELIHPFRDGNGRVGRLILAAQLKNMAGLDMHPPLDCSRALPRLHGLCSVVWKATSARSSDRGVVWHRAQGGIRK
jgi:fido (protein-threonine AMPylation protein)